MSLDEWHKWLREWGCVISGYRGPEVVLHHIVGGSVGEVGIHRGKSQKTPDWYVIPLHRRYHTGTVDAFHDIGVDTWEDRFGDQLLHYTDLVQQWESIHGELRRV